MNRRGVTLLLTLIIMVSLTVMTMAYLVMVSYSTKNLGGQVNNVKAFYLADAGINKAIWYLLNTAPDSSTDGSWRTTAYPAAAGANPTDPQEEALGNGAYTIWVEDSGSDVLVTSLGVINNIERIIQQTVTLSSSGGTPEAFEYITFSSGNVSYQNSDGTITGNIAAGNNINTGDMTFGDTSTEDSSIVTPTVDMDAYAAIADNTVSGNKTFTSGTYTGIWYIDGKVTIDSGVIINGSIIATDKVDFSNNANVTITATSPNPAIVSQSNINANRGTINITGLIFAGGTITMNSMDDSTINGSLIAGNHINVQNGDNLTVNYDADLVATPPPYFTGGGSEISIESVTNSWTEI